MNGGLFHNLRTKHTTSICFYCKNMESFSDLNSKGKKSNFTHFVSSFDTFHKNLEGCGGLSECEEYVVI